MCSKAFASIFWMLALPSVLLVDPRHIPSLVAMLVLAASPQHVPSPVTLPHPHTLAAPAIDLLLQTRRDRTSPLWSQECKNTPLARSHASFYPCCCERSTGRPFLVTFPAASSAAKRYSSLYRDLHSLFCHERPTGAIPRFLGTFQSAVFPGSGLASWYASLSTPVSSANSSSENLAPCPA